MPAQSSSTERRVDSDGVTRVEQRRAGKGTWLVGGAVGVLLACLGLSLWLSGSADPETPAPKPPTRAAAQPPPVRAQAPVTRPSQRLTQPAAHGAPVMEPTVTPEDDVPTEEVPIPDEYGGEKSGLALFVPGTDPVKQGIVVPEDFELPPGYVRHYQSTDDGQQLEAILMFHPDHNPVDANGQPIPLPENRVVPPEMAPAGLPIRMLQVPKGEAEPRP